MNTKTLFSHKSDHWKTPKEAYDLYMNDGYFDPCPYMCDQWDGLQIEWKEKNAAPFPSCIIYIDERSAKKDRVNEIILPYQERH